MKKLDIALTLLDDIHFIIYHKQKKSKSLNNFKSIQYPNSIQYEKCSVLAGLKVFPELVLVIISFKE